MSVFSRLKWLPVSDPRRAWLDATAVLGSLTLLNGLLTPADFGWMKVNPSPYLIAPILLGCRYGFSAGVSTGLAALVIMLAGAARFDRMTAYQVASEHGYLLGGLVVIGGLCGQVQQQFRRKELQATAENENLRNRLKILDGDIVLLQQAKSELERLVAVRDGDVSTLDVEIRKLFDAEGDELYEDLLMVLNRQARITDAALYLFDSGPQLIRKALLGDGDNLPESLLPASAEIVELAVQNKTSITVPQFWRKDDPGTHDYLMCVPLVDGHSKVLGVVLVTAMPFLALGEKAVQIAGLICRWAARVIELKLKAVGSYRLVKGLPNQRIFEQASFDETLALTLDSARLNGLPSSLVLFELPNMPMERQESFERAVVTTFRAGDFPSVMEIKHPNVIVLLPLTGERGAAVFLNRVLLAVEREKAFTGKVRARTTSFSGSNSAGNVLADFLNEGAQNTPAH